MANGSADQPARPYFFDLSTAGETLIETDAHMIRYVAADDANQALSLKFNESTAQYQRAYVGMGYNHYAMTKVWVQWDANPGKTALILIAGSADKADPSKFEAYPSESAGNILVTNTTAQAVPITGNGTPLPVAATGSVAVTQSTNPWNVAQDQTPSHVDDYLPSGAAVEDMTLWGGSIGTGGGTIYTVPAGKVATLKTMSFGGDGYGPIKVWIEDGSGNAVWSNAVAQRGYVLYPNIKLSAGYVIKAKTTFGNSRVMGCGYLETA